MSLSLKNIYTTLFFIGLFFIPFNEFEGLEFLGEYSDEAATYFFLVGFALVGIEALLKGKLAFPYKNNLSIILFAFLAWTFVSTMLNYETVSENYFKATSGLSRYLRQTFSLFFSAIVFTVLFWNVIKNYSISDIFLKIRRVFLFSFLFVSLYGFIEIAIVYFGMGFLKPILESFDFFPFVNTNYHTGSRIGISSVTFEIPALGTYLIMALPWMMSYIFTEKHLYKFIPTGFALVLLFFSDSRSALIVIFIQLFFLIVLLVLDQKYRKSTLNLLKLGAIGVAAVLVFNAEKIITTVTEKADTINFSKNLTKSVSNKSRFGIQHATMEVFKENPIIGVGLGQNAYHAVHHYPYWATVNNWEFKLKYKNQTEKSFPPNYNIYTRLAAELGIIGVGLFLLLIGLCVYYSFLIWKFSSDKMRFVGAILLLSFIGLGINWAQLDYFRQYGFWLCMMLLIHIILLKRKSLVEESNK